MSKEMMDGLMNRRDVLRRGTVVGGGLLASAFTGGSIAAADEDNDNQTGIVGYVSRSSYRKITGSDDVDCVPNQAGWGDSFYVERVAEDYDGEAGVSATVPDPSASGTAETQCTAYTITADEHVDLTGGPSGHGPWRQDCGSWAFVEDGTTLEMGTVYRISKVHSTESIEADYEDITATDSDGEEIGLPMDLMRVSFERAPPAAQWTQKRILTMGGSATAVDGTTAILSSADEGPATVLTLTDDGWTEATRFGSGDDIGGVPAISGDTVVFNGPVNETKNRSVVVYARTDGVWEKQATLRPDDLDWDAGFGTSFAIDGETLVVGAPEDDGTNESSDGAVYVYTRSDGTWNIEATLEDTRDIEDSADGLGSDVAVAGDTVVAGAPYTTYEDFRLDNVGAGLIFTRSDGGWSQEAFLRSDKPDDRDHQGDVVAIENDTVVMASPRACRSEDWSDHAGTAWVFTRDGTAWSQQARITPDDWATGDWFASSISLDGERMLVGSNTRDRDGNAAKGAAYIFTRNESTWDQAVKLTARDGTSRDQFGSSVALEGTFAFVGAKRDGSDKSTYVFEQ